ncbi:hypothetical protein [Burkholderia vietnamiensis]|uniref:hypothetical protein n=1 Tax=Burkholderia vietnamiensis TaxID=60552 RepID=UPI001B96E31A|nr:hypothetical protein [Burkholderia vietnamiensis]MBR8054169.1 hypothetical protein [Burkholderia vietnamiensis]
MNVKPGDLAMVSGCPVDGLNGRPVEVLSAGPEMPAFGPTWNCTCESMRDEGYQSLPIPDSMLRRIGGVPVTDDISDEVIA